MDEDQNSRHHHPSESIPNAAYPDDSNYQPGQGHLRPNPPLQATSFTGATSILSPQATYQASGRSHSYTPGSQGFGSSSTWTGPELSTSPSSPPPPYDPNNVPAAFTPLGTSHTSSHASTGQYHRPGDQRRRFGEDEAIPLQTLRPAAAAASPRSEHSQTSMSATDPFQQQAAATSLSSSSATAVELHSRRESYNKLGPLDAAKRRRLKRKLKIGLIIMFLSVIFLVALVVSVTVTLLKRKPHHNDPSDGGNPQAFGQGQQP